jgi:hypothetical protein
MAGRITEYIRTVKHWRMVMGLGPIRMLSGTGSKEYLYIRWQEKAQSVLRSAEHPPHESQWQCIHGHESQSWSTDTGNGYYGGLQMDLSFQGSYGAYLLNLKGTANNWTPLEQMWVAERAFSSGRGFGPWPNTARYCGLL